MPKQKARRVTLGSSSIYWHQEGKNVPFDLNYTLWILAILKKGNAEILGDVLWLENKAHFKLGSLWGKGRKEGTVRGMTNFRTSLCERLTNAKFTHLPPHFSGDA